MFKDLDVILIMKCIYNKVHIQFLSHGHWFMCDGKYGRNGKSCVIVLCLSEESIRRRR
jgi:hypothetical protein